MLKKLQSPLLAAALSLGLSLLLGSVLCWRAALPLLELAATARPKPVDDKKAKGWDFWTIVSTDLKEERARLRQQAEQQDQRAARLAAEQRELDKIRAGIDGLRQQIADKVIEITADEAKNIRTLAQTYTNLSPRAAVAIFREMDDLTAVKILSLMKPDVVGPIFEEMSRTAGTDGPLSRRAAVLSEKLRLMKAAKAPSPS
ncbi:MAG: hypothetical protein NT173_13390 [Opitutales bacterium]|nr:hypothetical protein [Opitutales bacterium]